MRLLLVLAALLPAALAVDRAKFRTCAQTHFCAHFRPLLGLPTPQIAAGSAISLANGVLSKGGLSVACLASGAVRVRIVDPESPRWESPDVVVDAAPGVLTATSEANLFACGTSFVRVESEPWLKILVTRADKSEVVSLGERGGIYFERQGKFNLGGGTGGSEGARQAAHEEREVLDWGEDGKPIYKTDSPTPERAEEAKPAEPEAPAAPAVDRASPESFGGHVDNKPRGPMSVGFDASFVESVGLYGLPEHASSFALKDTDGKLAGSYKEPFRLYNLDVFEYELDEPMALYGAIPFIVSRDQRGRKAGIFSNNPSETFVDVSTPAPGSRATRWMSESGVLDVTIFPGPTYASVMDAYTRMTGRPLLPPLFSLAYHQCRWNYRDQKDVEEVYAKFEELDFPVDVIWLDIEHTDGKRYFTWDKQKFPDPAGMQKALARTGRRMVTIVDPHVKRDSGYHVHSEAEKLGMYVRENNADFEGWCWPGSSSYPDFTSPKVREWWGGHFKTYDGATDQLAIWNDMNEPSVFNGPEVSMRKTVLNLEGVEHREWHNLYGFYYHMATKDGLLAARAPLRPFVLTRSLFAGSQRLGAVWTGDNKADWAHLRISVPMILSLGAAGMPFSGADVGGFFGNPDAELLTRWYQAGAFQPFFRAHAHIDTKRREPWLFGETVLQQLRAAVATRYTYLPYIYTLFEEASRTGMPVMRPLWAHDEDMVQPVPDVETVWLLGKDLLIQPVMDQGVVWVRAQVPAYGAWYDVERRTRVVPGEGVSAPIGFTPVFQRAGSIVPRQMRLRRSSDLMRRDPYTLDVVTNAAGTAEGQVFFDDQQTTNPASRRVNVALTSKQGGGYEISAKTLAGAYPVDNVVERVRILGLDGCTPRQGSASQGGKTWTFDVECGGEGGVVLRKPWVALGSDFVLSF